MRTGDLTPVITAGRQICGSLEAASRREWLVTDGLGGYAMGTVSGLRTRRYHGLLVVATEPPIGRRLALASLDPVVVIGDERIQAGDPRVGRRHPVDPPATGCCRASTLRNGIPCWRWDLGEVVIERELAMVHGRPAVGIVHRVVRTPRPVRLELEALCTWRDVHGERFGNGPPAVEVTADGFAFEGAYRVSGPGFEPDGSWYRGVRAPGGGGPRAERGRGPLVRRAASPPSWTRVRPPRSRPGPATSRRHRRRPRPSSPGPRTGRGWSSPPRAPTTRPGAQLALAADQLVVDGPDRRRRLPVVRRLVPRHHDLLRGSASGHRPRRRGTPLLLRAAESLSEGMLANTADAGGTEYNTVDGTLWFLHAVDRHVALTGDDDLAAALADDLLGIVDHHLAGTRFGIRVDPDDGLLTQGADGWALTWMDARVDGRPVTPAAGKPVEVNALWINGLAAIAGLLQPRRAGTARPSRAAEAQARASFPTGSRSSGAPGWPTWSTDRSGDDWSVRPNQLLAASLPHASAGRRHGRRGVRAARDLARSALLAPADPALPRPPPRRAGRTGRGLPPGHGVAVADRAVRRRRCRGGRADADGLLDGLEDHLAEWGLGSVSETADAHAPHRDRLPVPGLVGGRADPGPVLVRSS